MGGEKSEKFSQAEFRVGGFGELVPTGVTVTKRSFLDRLLGRKGEEGEAGALEQGELFEEPRREEESIEFIDSVPEGTPLSFEIGRRGLNIPPVEKQLGQQRREERRLAREAARLEKEEEKRRKRKKWEEVGGTPGERAAAYDQAARDRSDQIGRPLTRD